MSQNPFDKLTVIKAHEYHKSRDFFSPIFHVQKADGTPLCGERSLPFGTSPVTVTDVLDSPNELANGWHWCGVCGSKFTGESAELFFPTPAVHC